MTIAPASLDEPLGPQRAVRLLLRAGFAPAAAEVQAIASLGHAAAVDTLLAAEEAVPAPPPCVAEPLVTYRQLRDLPALQREQAAQAAVRQMRELRGWWLQHMTATRAPLRERVTLFWHNHFVSAFPKVRQVQLLYRQNHLLRTHAMGNFGALLQAVARDPAMLVYLDGAQNRRARPNENFAREVMELFTLGEGNYGEADIREAARAFTGWSLDADTLEFAVLPWQHDPGEKTLLGRRGRLDGAGALEVLLAQPATAEFITRKLWLEFVSPQPDGARVKALADAFRAEGYALAPLLGRLLLQPEVLSGTQEDALVKSPVELVVGLARQSGAVVADAQSLGLATGAMGQTLFGAPNVRGWPGGETWINTQSLLARKQFVERALAAAPATMAAMPAAMAVAAGTDGAARGRLAVRAPLRVDAAAWLAPLGMHPEREVGADAGTRLGAALLAMAPVHGPRGGELGIDALRATVLDPAYQLK